MSASAPTASSSGVRNIALLRLNENTNIKDGQRPGAPTELKKTLSKVNFEPETGKMPFKLVQKQVTEVSAAAAPVVEESAKIKLSDLAGFLQREILANTIDEAKGTALVQLIREINEIHTTKLGDSANPERLLLPVSGLVGQRVVEINIDELITSLTQRRAILSEGRGTSPESNFDVEVDKARELIRTQRAESGKSELDGARLTGKAVVVAADLVQVHE